MFLDPSDISADKISAPRPSSYGKEGNSSAPAPEKSAAPAEPAPAPAPPAAPSEKLTDPTPAPAPATEPAAAKPTPASEPDASTPPAPAPAPEVNWADLSGGKIKTKEELEALLTAPRWEPANDQVRMVNDLVAKGITDVKGALELQAMDFDAMDPIDVIRMAAKLEKKHLSDEDLELMLDDKYKLDQEFFDDREKRLGKAKATEDAIAARETLKAFQAKQIESAPDYEAMAKQWGSEVDAATSTLKKLEVKAGEATVNIEVSDQQNQELNAALKDPEWLSKTYGKKQPDGSTKLDVGDYAQNALWMIPSFREKAIAAIIAQGASNGVQTYDANIKNPSTPTNTNTPPKKYANDTEAYVDGFKNAKKVGR